jgi:hypothetical protein
MSQCSVVKIVYSCCCKTENNQTCSCDKKISVIKTDYDIALQSRIQNDFQENLAIYVHTKTVQLNSLSYQSLKLYPQQKFKYLHSINLPLLT